MRIIIPHRAIHITMFLLLAFVCYEGHQLTRLLVGAALCGGLGTMTFTVTIPRQPCALPLLEALSGPVFTYGLAYLGMLALRWRKFPFIAYAVIFASFSHLRWIQNLTGRGDELVLAQQWSAAPSRLLVAFLVLLIGFPPLWAAFHVIANAHRVRTFAVSYLLPVPVLILLLFGNRLLFGESGSVPPGTGVLGISWIVLSVDLLALALLFIFGPLALSKKRST